MKTYFFVLLVTMLPAFSPAQRPPAFPNQVAPHVAAQPTANVKPLNTAHTSLGYIILQRWRGARLRHTATAAVVDSMWLEFDLNKTFSFKHQAYELNGPTAGTYSISGNKLEMQAIKFPFTHRFTGTYDAATGIISGTYTEELAPDATQPPYYSPGTFTGTFTLKAN